MPKSINDLYCESQLRVAALEEELAAEKAANMNSCRTIAKLVRGELQTNQFAIVETPDAVQWSYVELPAQTPEPPKETT